MRSVLRRRDFGLLFGGHLVSITGDFVLLVALPFWIYQLTGSIPLTGLAFIALRVPQVLLAPFAGVLVDRWDRKATMIASDLVRAAIVCGLLLVHSAGQAWLIAVLALAESTASQFFSPARSAILPKLVERDDLVQANAAMGFAEAVGRLGGPALGGVLLAAFGGHGAALFDAATYLISATAISFVRVPGGELPLSDTLVPAGTTGARGALSRFGSELAGGFRLVRERPVLRMVFTSVGVAMFSEGIFSVLIVAVVRSRWHGGASQLGLLMSGQAVGALLAGPAIGALARRVDPRLLLGYGASGCGVLLIAIVNQPSLYAALPLIAIAGAFIVAAIVGIQTLIQLGSDDHNRGRISSLLTTTMAASTLLSSGIASVIGARVGAVHMFDVGGAAWLTGGLIALLTHPSGTHVYPGPVDPDISNARLERATAEINGGSELVEAPSAR